MASNSSRAVVFVVVALLCAAAACRTACAEEEARGWLGVSVRPLDDADREEAGFEGEHGLMIVAILPNGPAARTELRPGDILTRLGSLEIEGFDHLREVLSDTRPGKKLGFVAWRDGRLFDGTVVLGEPPREGEAAERREPADVEARFRAVQAERAELGARREKIEARIREVRDALHRISDEGWEKRVRELSGELIDLCREAGRLQVRAEVMARQAAEIEAAIAARRGQENPERQAARRQVEAMRLAMKALAEAGNREGEELVERKIHAIELALAGRRDAEARRIQEKAPGPGDVAKLLLFAADFYRRHDAPDRADVCERVGRELQDRWRRLQPQQRPQGESPARERPQPADALERLEREVRQLRDRMERLERALEARARQER